jgi:hypothetical protein
MRSSLGAESPVAKTISATDLLRAGRRQDRSEPPRTEQLDDSASSHLDVQTSERLDVEAPEATPQPTEAQPSNSTSKRLDAQSYERATVFFTPDQRRWLKETAKSLPVEGLSASDIARLALNRLRQEVDSGDLILVEALSEQAHEEAATHPGRRNRGLPPRQQ